MTGFFKNVSDDISHVILSADKLPNKFHSSYVLEPLLWHQTVTYYTLVL